MSAANKSSSHDRAAQRASTRPGPPSNGKRLEHIPGKHSPVGRLIIEGLDELIETLEAGGMAAVEKKFTVRRVKVTRFDVPSLKKADIVAIRASLGVSQPVFASLLGVSPALVKGWEQGLRKPSGIALRFLAEIRRNPKYWKGRVTEAARAV